MTYAGWSTLLGGSLMALGEVRVKKLVAYRTLSQIGMATLTFGLGQLTLGYYHLLRHGFLKCLLFLGVGNVIHSGYNQQEIRKSGGAAFRRSVVQLTVSFSLLSLCGLLYTRGIGTKEMLMALYRGSSHFWVLYLGVVISVFLTFLYRGYLWRSLFVRTLNPTHRVGERAVITASVITPSVFSLSWFNQLMVNHVGEGGFTPHAEQLIPLLFVLFGYLLYQSLGVGSFLSVETQKVAS